MILQIIGLIVIFFVACYMAAGAFVLFAGSAMLGGKMSKGEWFAGLFFAGLSGTLFYYVFSHFSVSLS